MKKFNITAPRKYQSNGEEKTFWANVGTLVKFEATPEKPEGYILELNMFPDTKFMVFEAKERERQEVEKQESPKETSQEVEEEINPDDIPF